MRSPCQSNEGCPSAPRLKRWLVAPIFSALAAWLTAASIVNISATLKYYGVGGGNPAFMCRKAERQQAKPRDQPPKRRPYPPDGKARGCQS